MFPVILLDLLHQMVGAYVETVGIVRLDQAKRL